MSNEQQQTPQNGWGKPTATSRKYHYFDGFRSLCGKYGWIGSRDLLHDEFDDHRENCVACKQRRLASTQQAS